MAKHSKSEETTNVNVVETTSEPVAEGNLAVQSAPAPAVAYDPEGLARCKTVSEKIRFLNAAGLTKGQIAKTLDKRYQHVRNVLITPLKSRG